MLLSQTACVRASLLQQFLHEADMWEWEQGPFWIVRSKMCLIRNLTQTCKAFSEVYRGDLRNIALNWLQRVLINRYRENEMQVPYHRRERRATSNTRTGDRAVSRERPRLIATRKSFPDYRAVLKGLDFVSRVLPLEDSSSEYLSTSASEPDTETDVSLPDDSSEAHHWISYYDALEHPVSYYEDLEHTWD